MMEYNHWLNCLTRNIIMFWSIFNKLYNFDGTVK